MVVVLILVNLGMKLFLFVIKNGFVYLDIEKILYEYNIGELGVIIE